MTRTERRFGRQRCRAQRGSDHFVHYDGELYRVADAFARAFDRRVQTFTVDATNTIRVDVLFGHADISAPGSGQTGATLTTTGWRAD